MGSGQTDLKALAEFGLLDAIADGLLVCDEEGAIQAVNRRVEQLSGYRESELVGKRVEMLVPRALHRAHESHRHDFSDSGHPTRPMGSGLDTRLVTKAGQEVPVDIALAPLVTDAGTLVITGVRDITARRHREKSIAAIREVSDSILTGQTEHAVYSLISRHARDLAEAEVALVALRRPNDRQVVVEAGAGLDEGTLLGTALRDDIWETAADRSGPTVVVDGLDHFRSLVGRPIGSVCVIPLTEGQGVGFLLVGGAVGRDGFGDPQVELLETFASQASLASTQARRLRIDAVAGDRDRIARDMHDLVIQRLFGAGLSLQVAAQIFDHEPDLTRRLDDVVEMLDMSIAELRRSIFDLEQRHQLDIDSRIKITIDEAMSGEDVEIAVDIDASGDLTEETATHLLATLREALSNSRRHAAPSRIEVSIAIHDDVVLVVSDDGSGMPETPIMGHGLANMAERARQLDGQMDLSTSANGGLNLRWQVPNHSRAAKG